MLHRTIAAVRDDMAAMSFNTAIARLTECNNHLTQVVAREGAAPREVVLPLVLMVAPLAPHIAEELWARLGHPDTLTYEPFPAADPALLVDDTVEVPVQVNGKVRARITVPAGADEAEHERLARADPRIAALLDGEEVRKVIIVPGRMVNFVHRLRCVPGPSVSATDASGSGFEGRCRVDASLFALPRCSARARRDVMSDPPVVPAPGRAE